jgi:protoporphyrinogen oxidase
MALKVAICGGGIGGLTTALCIDRLCGDNVALEVFEQAPEYKVFYKILEN